MNNISDKQGFTTNYLKIIAIIAMTMDHIAFVFFIPNTISYQIFRIIGKLTIVIMCYMIVEGYNHTHNRKKYMLRLFIFAIISHLPFVFFSTGKISLFFGENKFQTSVIWTLFLGLVSLCIWDYEKLNKLCKMIILIFISILATYGDWKIFGILLIWGFAIFYRNRKKQMIFLVAATMYIFILSLSRADPWYKEIYILGLLLTIPILIKYNGNLGKSKYIKWLFYIYYPLHMIILRIISFCLY